MRVVGCFRAASAAARRVTGQPASRHAALRLSGPASAVASPSVPAGGGRVITTLDGFEALDDLAAAGAPIQVAEQYQFQPLLAAQLAIASSGRPGTVRDATVSVAHGCHGVDLIRRFLGVGLEAVSIAAHRFASPIVAGRRNRDARRAQSNP